MHVGVEIVPQTDRQPGRGKGLLTALSTTLESAHCLDTLLPPFAVPLDRSGEPWKVRLYLGNGWSKPINPTTTSTVSKPSAKKQYVKVKSMSNSLSFAWGTDFLEFASLRITGSRIDWPGIRVPGPRLAGSMWGRSPFSFFFPISDLA